ncbi:ABC transporter permease [Demequina sp. NBRC 110056]|uniref:ABC transporter permease n=1 Tax=Demequina sp. NBRC 110056 TaxID=1570345 RepID=UPI0009FC6469|nr:ABC transporter permease [Demequina sp. NBRC 110056]
MLLYSARRLLAGFVLFVIVAFITYWLLSFSFDSVIAARLGASATPETIAEVRADYGLDRPVVVQYVDWLAGVFQGDLGRSFYTQEPVIDAIPPRLFVTLSIVVPALIIATIIAVFLGTFAASRGGGADKAAQGVMLFGYLVPNLLIAILLTVVLAINLGWLPATGYVRFGDDPAGWLKSITIPVIALFIGGAANIANQVRGTMIDELRKDYVRTLRTRGVSARTVVYKHALRNAAGPALTVFGLTFINMFGGALIIEQVFALPGFGTFSFNSALQGDFPVLMGLTVFGVGMTVTINLLTDLANGWLNPKARIYA